MATAVVAPAYGGPEVLSVVDTEVPEPGPGEVRIQVRAAGVNPIDFKIYSGAMGDAPDALPLPVGYEVSGVVTAVGPDAEGPAGPVSVGDEVVAYRVDGGYASELVAPASVVVPKPAELGWEDAAGLLLAGSTALHTVTLARPGPKDTVLVHGASGAVGMIAVQLAKAGGARVLGTASPRNHDLLRSLGVEPFEYGDGLYERVAKATPECVDAAIDTVGTDEAVDVSLKLVADKRRIVSIAAFHRAATGIPLVGGAPGADPGTEIRANAWRTLLPAAATGELRLLPVRSYPLTEAAAAHTLLREGHPNGKLVLVPRG
jgi:NADPH:quinone reductase